MICLGQTFRGLNPTENLDKFFSAIDLEEISQYDNKPLALLHFCTEKILEPLRRAMNLTFFAVANR